MENFQLNLFLRAHTQISVIPARNFSKKSEKDNCLSFPFQKVMRFEQASLRSEVRFNTICTRSTIMYNVNICRQCMFHLLRIRMWPCATILPPA
jgi:hypothetical protein